MNDGPALYGHDLFGEPVRPTSAGPLAARFVFPPFSVLDARSGPWQERKRAWLGLGIRSEIGRGRKLTYRIPMGAWNPNEMADEYYSDEAMRFSTSVFDPVLCELVYRWFAPTGGHVLDPFAGGSVRGVVASALGLPYYGIDLSAAQVAANREQVGLCVDPVPRWEVGDSAVALAVHAPPSFDLVFTCPPYGDLERYSDDPRDLSTMEYETFVDTFATVVRSAVSHLRYDRFAAVVVGDFRAPSGVYRNFPGDTVAVFAEAGLALYNEVVVLTAVGSAALRAGRTFAAGRKLIKCHQELLVFVKGDPRAAARAARPVPPPTEVAE